MAGGVDMRSVVDAHLYIGQVVFVIFYSPYALEFRRSVAGENPAGKHLLRYVRYFFH
jgi:hypothetical protein